MMAENWTIAVDGGGSGCRLAAFDREGRLCASTVEGPASLSVDEGQAWRNIRRGIDRLAAQLDQAAGWLPSVLCLGLSGALQSTPRERFLALLPDSTRTILITDGHAQLLGATGGSPGACLAVGTGSALYWIDNTNTIGMAGGWGFPIGDEGSGAWLGFRLLNAYLWHRDRRQAGSPIPDLFRTLENMIGPDVSDVQAWSTCKSSTMLARLAPVLVTAADQGDTFASALLKRGARQCERLLAIAPDVLPVFFVGGLASIYQPYLEPTVQARLKQPLGDALSGLYAMSLTQRERAT